MPRPTAAAIAIVVIGAVAVFLLVGRTESDAPDGGSAPTDSVDGAAGPAPRPAAEPNATVEYIVDGDTIDVEIAGDVERVRLIGIDTPETKRPDSPIECWGPEASAFITELLPVGSEVLVERDTVGRDDYGRLLGYVYRSSDGMFVNVELVRRGFAQPLTIPPNTVFADVFVDAARQAEADDLGLWAAC